MAEHIIATFAACPTTSVARLAVMGCKSISPLTARVRLARLLRTAVGGGPAIRRLGTDTLRVKGRPMGKWVKRTLRATAAATALVFFASPALATCSYVSYEECLATGGQSVHQGGKLICNGGEHDGAEIYIG